MTLDRDRNYTVIVHTENKIKRNRNLGVIVSIITESEDKKYIVSFLQRRRLHNNGSVP